MNYTMKMNACKTVCVPGNLIIINLTLKYNGGITQLMSLHYKYADAFLHAMQLVLLCLPSFIMSVIFLSPSITELLMTVQVLKKESTCAF